MPRRSRATFAQQRGFVLPMVIFALMIMGVLVAAALTTGADDRHASLSVQEGTRSFYTAEAGLNQVLATWDSLKYDTLIVAAGSSADLGWQTLAENGSRYRVVIQRLTAGQSGSILVTVDGRSSAPRSGLRTVSLLLLKYPSLGYSVFGRDSASMAGGATTDSYNSDSTAYGPGGTDGDIGSNGNITLIGGGTRVNGDATSAGFVSDPTKISGTSTNGAPLVTLPGVSCPTGGYTLASGIPSPSWVSYNETTGNLAVAGHHNLTLPVPPTAYYFNQVILSGNASLTVSPPPGQHVDIYISDSLDVSGGFITNTAAKPTAVTIWGCGSSTKSWALSGGSGSYYAVYTPGHPLAISGHSDLYGSFVGASVAISGGAKIHYDKALAQKSLGASAARGSWTEVSR